MIAESKCRLVHRLQDTTLWGCTWYWPASYPDHTLFRNSGNIMPLCFWASAASACKSEASTFVLTYTVSNTTCILKRCCVRGQSTPVSRTPPSKTRAPRSAGPLAHGYNTATTITLPPPESHTQAQVLAARIHLSDTTPACAVMAMVANGLWPLKHKAAILAGSTAAPSEPAAAAAAVLQQRQNLQQAVPGWHTC